MTDTVAIKLTDEQTSALAPLFAHAEREYNAFYPGAIVAQIVKMPDGTASARVGFWDNAQVTAVQSLAGIGPGTFIDFENCKTKRPQKKKAQEQ